MLSDENLGQECRREKMQVMDKNDKFVSYSLEQL